MGGWSKEQIKQLTGIAEGTIAHMRRAKTWYEDKSDHLPATKEFRQRIGVLAEAPWWLVRLEMRNAKPEERTIEQKAQTLAKTLRSRLEGKLSEDPEISARALAIYDPTLPGRLLSVLSCGMIPTPNEETEADKLDL
jgi:hypothetical protein